MKHGGLLVKQPPCFISKLMSKKLKVNSIQKMGLFYTKKMMAIMAKKGAYYARLTQPNPNVHTAG